MGFKMSFGEDVDPWIAGTGKAPRCITIGVGSLVEGETKNGKKVLFAQISAPEETWIPDPTKNDGSLIKADSAVAVKGMLFIPDGSGSEAQEKASSGKILGYFQMLAGKDIPRNRDLDVTRKSRRIAIMWDPSPPGSDAYDEHRPLNDAGLEKLEAGEYRVLQWPQDSRVQRAGTADAKGKTKPTRKRFDGKKKDEEPAAADTEDFLADDDDF